MLARVWRRLRQFFGALRSRVPAEERAEAFTHLNEQQRALFESMTLRDQQHGLIVYERVRLAAPYDDPELFIAALLHDCGKGHVSLWQRVLHVALGAAAPGLRPRLASGHGAAWRQAMWRLLHHPALGAELVARTGADDDTVRMIREQEHAEADPRLALLQAADDA